MKIETPILVTEEELAPCDCDECAQRATSSDPAYLTREERDAIEAATLLEAQPSVVDYMPSGSLAGSISLNATYVRLDTRVRMSWTEDRRGRAARRHVVIVWEARDSGPGAMTRAATAEEVYRAQLFAARRDASRASETYDALTVEQWKALKAARLIHGPECAACTYGGIGGLRHRAGCPATGKR